MENQQEENNNEIINLANEILKEYKIQWFRLFRKPVRLSKLNSEDKHWIAAAKLCLAYNISPTLLVEKAFEVCDTRYRKVPLPASLSGKQVIDALNQWRGTQGEAIKDIEIKTKELYQHEIKLYVDSQFRLLEQFRKCQANITNKDPNYRITQIVRMPAFSIPAWLRLVVAPDDEVVIARFGREALEELCGEQYKIKGLKEELERRSGTNVDDICKNIRRKLI